MKINPIEIINAWIRVATPTEAEKELAEARMNICLKCDFRKEVIHNKEWSAVCGGCGCPLKAKIFTDQYGSCPQNKWEIIEKKHIKTLKIKEKSII